MLDVAAAAPLPLGTCSHPAATTLLFPLLEKSSIPRPPQISAILLPRGQEETNQL